MLYFDNNRPLLAMRVIAAYIGQARAYHPTVGGLSPSVLRRAIDRLRSDNDADITLAALASDAGLSRFHLCRAFKRSTGLSSHNWLRRRRLEQAMNVLRDPNYSVALVAATLGYASQTAFAVAFRRLTSEAPRGWWRRINNRNPSSVASIALAHPQNGFAKSWLSTLVTLGAKNGLDQLHQANCEAVATRRFRNDPHVRNFSHLSILFRNKRTTHPDVFLGKDQCHDLHHH